ncbi:hypothetical protein SNEBB_001038 [Seison nebaliae]|nr:hypothetical protein SNEBB_001038 [Seison nebaliae]
MGKSSGGFLTPKAISNRIKARGLQKLKWFCQMCQKQCRDDNGFKCHIQSESHQRQLLTFTENPGRFLDEFSRTFHQSYLTTLKHRFGTKRVHANLIYQEFIKDRFHVHMNSTKWYTLTGYIKWLGKEGICLVDETDKGWFIQYIDRDPERLQREADMRKRERAELTDAERQHRQLLELVENDKKNEKQISSCSLETEVENFEKLKEINLKWSEKMRKEEDKLIKKDITSDIIETIFKDNELQSEHLPLTGKKRKHDRKNIDLIREEVEEAKKKKDFIETHPSDAWLMENIMVKICTDSVGEEFEKKKGKIVKVNEDKFSCVVRVQSENKKWKKILFDQDHLQTVIPKEGREVLIVRGEYKGKKGRMIRVKSEKKDFSSDIQLIDSDQLIVLSYSNFSKLSE